MTVFWLHRTTGGLGGFSCLGLLPAQHFGVNGFPLTSWDYKNLRYADFQFSTASYSRQCRRFTTCIEERSSSDAKDLAEQLEPSSTAEFSFSLAVTPEPSEVCKRRPRHQAACLFQAWAPSTRSLSHEAVLTCSDSARWIQTVGYTTNPVGSSSIPMSSVLCFAVWCASLFCLSF